MPRKEFNSKYNIYTKNIHTLLSAFLYWILWHRSFIKWEHSEKGISKFSHLIISAWNVHVSAWLYCNAITVSHYSLNESYYMQHTEKAQFGYTLIKPKARRDSAGGGHVRKAVQISVCIKKLHCTCDHNGRHMNICTSTSKPTYSMSSLYIAFILSLK